MKQLFKKPKSTKYIQYSEPNDEPIQHEMGKARARDFLHALGYHMLINTSKHEYQLPSLKNEIGDMERTYCLDVFAHHNIEQKVIVVEVDGPYHFGSKAKIAAWNLKREIVSKYLFENQSVKADNHYHIFNKWRYINIKTEEIFGGYALSDSELIGRLC